MIKLIKNPRYRIEIDGEIIGFFKYKKKAKNVVESLKKKGIGSSKVKTSKLVSSKKSRASEENNPERLKTKNLWLNMWKQLDKVEAKRKGIRDRNTDRKIVNEWFDLKNKLECEYFYHKDGINDSAEGSKKYRRTVDLSIYKLKNFTVNFKDQGILFDSDINMHPKYSEPIRIQDFEVQMDFKSKGKKGTSKYHADFKSGGFFLYRSSNFIKKYGHESDLMIEIKARPIFQYALCDRKKKEISGFGEMLEGEWNKPVTYNLSKIFQELDQKGE